MDNHDQHRSQGCDQYEWRADRRFVPVEHFDKLVDRISNQYDNGGDISYLLCRYFWCPGHKRFVGHSDGIMIAVDGACKGNGRGDAYATIGVYFSKSSRWNLTEVLTDPLPTNQKAELTACLRALQMVLRLRHTIVEGTESGLRTVVIKTDSEYVVKGMTEWIFKWNKNGFKTSKGSAVVNASLFKSIEKLVLELNDNGVYVSFLHVPRSRNKDADALANSRLSESRNMG